MRDLKIDRSGFRRRVFAILLAAYAVVYLFVTAGFAQDGTGLPPENAQNRTYGAGWDCNIGYREDDGSCAALDLPENAYATGRSYGTGWACRRGFVETAGGICAEIFVPENAFLRSSGYGWECERGYREERDTCVAIEVPDHAYLTNDNSGAGWACNRGFVEEAGACIAIAIPENGYLTNARHGAAWACERGFVETEDRCDPISVPANAFLDPKSAESAMPHFSIREHMVQGGAANAATRNRKTPASKSTCQRMPTLTGTAITGAATEAFRCPTVNASLGGRPASRVTTAAHKRIISEGPR